MHSTNAMLAQAAQQAPIIQVAAPDHIGEPTSSQEESTSQATEVISRQVATGELHVSTQGQGAGRPGTHVSKRVMRGKKVLLITHPHLGYDFTKITALLPVFWAVGWKTDIVLEQHDGHATKLTRRAADKGYDLVIADGDDEIINRVVNGVMGTHGKGQHSIVGFLPEAAARRQVAEASVPTDPVRVALALVESDIHPADVGRIRVQALTFPGRVQQQERQLKKGGEARKSKARRRWRGERFFLSTAGLSIDVAAGAVHGSHTFPIEIAAVEGDGQDARVLWSGEASQVILGNACRDAPVAETTTDACADKGKLDLCVIVAGDPLTTGQETGPLTFRSEPDGSNVGYFQGAHFLMTVPASTHLQLDGNVVQIEEWLSQHDRKVLQQVPDRSQVLVTYRFDAMPHALRIAIPQAYGNISFEYPDSRQEMHSGDELQVEKAGLDTHNQWHDEGQREPAALVNELLARGKKVSIVGMVVKPGKRPSYILGGYTIKSRTGEMRSIAVCIEQDTLVLLDTGEHISSADLPKLQEGAEVIAAGKKRKHGVIKARHLVVVKS